MYQLIFIFISDCDGNKHITPQLMKQHQILEKLDPKLGSLIFAAMAKHIQSFVMNLCTSHFFIVNQ